jgi:aromatic ring-cleaving dioxygenase
MPEAAQRSTAAITGYHAHVYYDEDSKPAAARLRTAVEQQFAPAVGRFHDQPIGPHPSGSYQIEFEPALFDRIIPWLMLNRGALTVFVHAESGDIMADHTGHVLWLGDSQPLRLDVLRALVAKVASQPQAG